jgi:Uma2 family endonuclease
MVKYTYSDMPLSTVAEAAVQYAPRKVWTFEEYINAEEFAERKHEFHNGKRTARTGATRQHNLLTLNMGTAINNVLNDRDDEKTEVYSSDMNVFIPAINKSVYPDVTVAAEEPIMKHKHVMMNPTLLVEVLSSSTQAYDKEGKFDHYKTLPSFLEYVLVSQKKPIVDVFYRESANEEWQSTRIEGLDGIVELRSIGCTLKMKDIYRRVFK